MLTKRFLVTGAIAALSLFLGCAPTHHSMEETLLDENWGRSFEEAMDNQIINPHPQKYPATVVGLDGEAAQRNVAKYHKSFEKEAPQSVNNINLGSLGDR